jgi:hypothetical protein
MLYFLLPPNVRARYGPFIRVALGVVAGVVGIFVMTGLLSVVSAVFIVWGVYGIIARHRAGGHQGAVARDRLSGPLR